MNDRMSLLLAFVTLIRKDASISSEKKRHARVMLSVFREEIITEEEYNETLNWLVENGYVEQVKESEWRITRTGQALCETLSSRILGETNSARLKELVQGYFQEKTGTYMKKLGERLKHLHESEEKKITDAGSLPIRAVGILLKLEYHSDDLSFQEYRVPGKMQEEEKFDTKVSSFRRSYLNKTGLPILTFLKEGVLRIAAFEELDQVEILDERLEETSKGRVFRIEVPGWNEAVASALMERVLKELGYKRLRWPTRSFMKYDHFDSVTTDAGMLREHASVRLDFSEMADDRLFIWAESRTSCRKTAFDLLTENFPDSRDKAKVLDFLSGFKQRIVPSGSIAKVKDIVFGADMDTETIPKTDMTFADYWKEKIGIPLTQQTQPIVIIQGWNGDLRYPAEMIFVDRHDLERRIGTFRGRAPRFEDPNLRAKKAEALFNELKSVRVENGLMKFLSADFESSCPLASELSSQGVFRKIVKVSPPLLEFARNSLSLDPMDVFDREFGPICGQKDIILSHVICPDDVHSHDLDSASEAIGKIYSSSNFGRFIKSDEPIIVKYDASEGIGRLEAKIRHLEKTTQAEKSVCLGVIPEDGEFYYAIKKLFPGRVGIPVQGLRLGTLSKLAGGRFKGGRFLSLQLLIKSLNKGECVWRLASAAGLSKEKVLYIGIGFSRTPGIRRVGKCAAVMHDAHGSGVTWNIFATPMVERTLTKQWFDTVLFRIRDIVQKENPERVTFYRHGSMYPIEAEAVEASLKECSWLSSTEVTFVSVIDEGRRRFYVDNWKLSNLPPGTAFVLNEKEALLSTSNYDNRELRQGTVIPIRLVKEFGEEDMASVLKEYHDQTYLNWSAPKTTSKYPLVLTIANRFAELTRENIPSESMFYLDM